MAEESTDESRAIFGRTLTELHSEIAGKDQQRDSVTSKTKFIPIGTAHDALRRNKHKLLVVFHISAQFAEREVGNGEADRFVSKVILVPAPERAATILAIILSLHSRRRFEPDSPVWQKFVEACVDDQKSRCLEDGKLPFKRNDTYQIFGTLYGGLFFDQQYTYCAHVLKVDAIHPVDLRGSHAPLPYLKEERIGSGHYGTVYAVTIERSHVRGADGYWPPEDVTFARKDIRLERSGDRTETTGKVEWDIFQLIRKNKHKHDEYITRIMACFIFEDKISLFMEKADMDLAALFRKADYPRPSYGYASRDIMKMANVAGALRYLHHEISDSFRGHLMCFHLDIKPENILVYIVGEHDPIFKLADFSISRVKQSAGRPDLRLSDLYAPRSGYHRKDELETQYGACTDNKVGPAATCIPPEALTRQKVDEKSDVWSFGCVLCIYLAWLCDGNESVASFLDARRGVASACDDRFVVLSDSKPALNPAVVDWLGAKCRDVGSLSSDHSYELIWHLLVGQVMQVDSKHRCCMKTVHERLSEISKLDPEQAEAHLAIAVSTPPTLPRPNTASIHQHPIPTVERVRDVNDGSKVFNSREEGPRAPVHVAESHEALSPRAEEPASVTSQTQVPRPAINYGSQALSAIPMRASSRGTQPFTRDLRCIKHVQARADVVEQRKATLSAQTPPFLGSSPTGLALGGPRISFIPWTSPLLHEIRNLTTGSKNTYLACLHAAGVTVFKVTHELERSDSVLVTCCDRQIRDCAIGSTKLALVPDTEKFELYLYDLQSLFPRCPSHGDVMARAGESQDIEAHCILDVAEQPEWIAMHPDPGLPSVVACLSRPDSNGARTLYLLNLDVKHLPVKRPIRSQDHNYILWKSTFQAEPDTHSILENHSELTFSSCGDQIIWTVDGEHNQRSKHIYSWHFGTSIDNPEPLRQFIPAQFGNDVSNTLINCLHLPRFGKTLAVYRYSMVVHADVKTDPKIINLPADHVPLQALATDGIARFYMVSEASRDNIEIIEASIASTDVSEPLKVVSRKVVPGVQLLSAGERLLHALLVQTGQDLQMLLIWSRQHSLLVPLQPSPQRLS